MLTMSFCLRLLLVFQEGSGFRQLYSVKFTSFNRVAWTIRDELIPLFGYVTNALNNLSLFHFLLIRPKFPDTCLSPDQPGFGQVVPSDQIRRRPRKTTQNSMMRISPACHAWTPVPMNPVTGFTAPSGEGSTRQTTLPQQWVMRNSLNPPFPINDEAGLHSNSPPAVNHKSALSPRTGLSIDIRLLNNSAGSPSDFREVMLPPIQSSDTKGYNSPYSLPPISAMEDLKGAIAQDSAAVLRRLRMDDDDYPRSKVLRENLHWEKRHTPVHPPL